MKKAGALLVIIIIITIIPLVFATGCSDKAGSGDKPPEEPGVTAELNQAGGNPAAAEGEKAESSRKGAGSDVEGDETGGEADEAGGRQEERQASYYSPFTGRPLQEMNREKAVMICIENSERARPQSGLGQASIIYEFLAEGGITRFMALYGREIPEEVGPVRSVRPYLIETAREYNALLLHAGASPAGFEMLAEGVVDHLDQIYKSGYYWRDSSRKPPHNLYTGADRIEPYRERLTGQEYQPRFSFQQISFIQTDDPRADRIVIRYWGGYKVIYNYDQEKNSYRRYLNDMEHPHLDAGGLQLTARNIIIQYSNTDVVDKAGRLEMELKGRDRALIFRDGIVISGYWEKNGEDWTQFYDQEGERVLLNPGQTWIQVVPLSTGVDYEVSGGERSDEAE